MLNEKARRTTKSRIWRIVGFGLSLLFILVAVWVFQNRQLLADHLVVASFSPSEQIKVIAERSELTDTGKRIFYATQPLVSEHADFNTQCPRKEEASAILGCYTSGDRIFIYNITNEKLDGMEEVTAVHEMLHAVWQRTGDDEREKLTAQLNAAYARIDDPALKTRMEYYQRTEPDQLVNELHSILGTEAASLSDELEAYYAQYFNRQAVTALHANYNEAYTTLTERSEAIYATMQTLSGSIEQRSTQYNQDIAALNEAINVFNTRANAGDFSSQSTFSAERSQLLARSESLEVARVAINTDIAQYEALYAEYQQIASEIQVLNDSTDSFRQLEAAPSL